MKKRQIIFTCIVLSLIIISIIAYIVMMDNEMQTENSNDDIFGAAYIPFISFIFSTPFFSSELLFLLEGYILLKNKLCGVSKYCILIATGISVLIIIVYLSIAFLMATNVYIGNVLPIFNEYILLLFGWISTFISLILYIIGKRWVNEN